MKGCRPLTENEIQDILDSFSGDYAARDRALFVLGVVSGFRISEMLSLQLGDVYRNGQVSDTVTVQRRHMKQRREGRTVPLNKRARAAIAAWVQEMAAAGHTDPGTYLFKSRKGTNQPISRQQASQILKGLFSDNGLAGKVATHSLRKTFAAAMYGRAVELQRGGALVDPILFVQKAMGHKNVNSTISYLSFNETLVNEAILGL